MQPRHGNASLGHEIIKSVSLWEEEPGDATFLSSEGKATLDCDREAFDPPRWPRSRPPY